MTDPTANSDTPADNVDSSGTDISVSSVELNPSSDTAGTPPIPADIEQSLAESPQKWVRTPPIDIFETEDGLVLRADLPGVAPDALELQVQDNRLTLFGHVSRSVVDEGALIHQEYNEGDFLRSFILSDDVDHDRISAKLSDGVLEVHLPRTPRSKPRKISVQTN